MPITMNRRAFCVLAGASVGSLLLPRPLLAQDEPALTVKKLRDNAWAIIGGGGNALLLQTGDGPILIDTKVAPVADELFDAVVTHGESAPRILINTHHHADHIGGNYRFTREDRNPVIHGHRNLPPRIKDTLDARIRPALLGDAPSEERKAMVEALGEKDFAPTHTFSNRHTIEHGGLTLKLRHDSEAHTDNDAVIRIDELNIVHMGDLVFHELHPYIDRDAGADTKRWQTFLRRAHDWCDTDTIVIPGHGKITDITALHAMSQYFDQLREVVQSAIDQGKDRDAIARMEPEVFADRGFERMRSLCLTVMFDELTAAPAEGR
jgi:cyclase